MVLLRQRVEQRQLLIQRFKADQRLALGSATKDGLHTRIGVEPKGHNLSLRQGQRQQPGFHVRDHRVGKPEPLDRIGQRGAAGGINPRINRRQAISDAALQHDLHRRPWIGRQNHLQRQRVGFLKRRLGRASQDGLALGEHMNRAEQVDGRVCVGDFPQRRSGCSRQGKGKKQKDEEIADHRRQFRTSSKSGRAAS